MRRVKVDRSTSQALQQGKAAAFFLFDRLWLFLYCQVFFCTDVEIDSDFIPRFGVISY